VWSLTNTITNVTAYVRCKATGADPAEQAVIIWRLGATEIESAAFSVSRVAFTNYSDSRDTDPDGNAWTVANVDALQIAWRASTLAATETITGSEMWADVTYTSGVSIPVMMHHYSQTRRARIAD
jgi:hypothetical protein